MIPDGWRSVRLADIADYKIGRTPARANSEYWAATEDGVAWVTISDMAEFGTVRETKEKITNIAFEDVFRGQTVRAGTLLMSFKLTIGRIATLGIDACHNEAIISIHPKAEVHQGYLGYFLSQVNYDDLQDRQIKGNTLNQEKIDRIEVWLPPLYEQSVIADVLDLLRSSIEIQQKALTCAKYLKRAAMHDLFTCGLRGERQRETGIGMVPESWKVTDFASVRQWLQYGTSAHCTTNSQPYPVLRIPNVEHGRVDSTDLKYCDMPAAAADKYLLKEGDLLFIRTNGVLERLGTCAVFAGNPEQALFASYLIRARLKQGVDPRYVAYFYASERGTSLVAGRATPAADGKYNLNTGTIDSLPLPMPQTVEEQREIIQVLEAIDRKIDLHKRKRVLLEDLFRALLQKLMNGEVRVDQLPLSDLEGVNGAPKVIAA